MRNKQGGVSLMGLITVLFLVVIVALFGMKIIPSFLEFRNAKAAIAQRSGVIRISPATTAELTAFGDLRRLGHASRRNGGAGSWPTARAR